MNAEWLAIAKPTTNEILDQITPFVMDAELERDFKNRFAARRKLANQIVQQAQAGQVTPDLLYQLLRKSSQTISTIISLLGLSQEEFKRHVTLARLEQRKDVSMAQKKFSEWDLDRIIREMMADRTFADSVFDLLLNGIRNRDLRRRVPFFLLAKLDGRRLASIGQGGLDALIRSGLKGSYDEGKGEVLIKEVKKILDEADVTYFPGEIHIKDVSRRFDCVIPNAQDPHVILEAGVFATTARELSEKGIMEKSLSLEIKKHYPQSVIVRVLDGIGWLARGGTALAKVLEAYDYVFTQKTLPGLRAVLTAHVPAEWFGRDS